jgi:hypothetical protein
MNILTCAGDLEAYHSIGHHFNSLKQKFSKYFCHNISELTQWVSKSEQLPEDDQLRPKHVAIDAILMLF